MPEKSEDETSSRCTCECEKSQNIKTKAEELGQKLSTEFESRFHSLINHMSNEIQDTKETNNRYHNEYDENGLKIFIPRASILTDLLEMSHIQTIYNVFVAVLFVFFLNTLVYDYLEGERLLDFTVFQWAFGKRSDVAWSWMKIQAYSLILYPLFTTYANNQLLQSWQRLPGVIWAIGYIGYIVLFLVFPIHFVYKHELPPASAFIIIIEQVRLLMKAHAFVRVNAGKVVEHLKSRHEKPEASELEALELPGFSQYIYFLFVPTLIYRDHYPMTREIRWNFVVKNMLQVLGCVFYAYFILARFCIPIFHNTGKEKGNLKTLLLSSFSCMLPGVTILLVTFFAMLHSWMNAFAEMLRFADRMFYMDWWNTTSFSRYYRMWNIVVHDWLYAYIYKDVVAVLGKKSQAMSAICVFLMSAVVHEYILTVALGFFFPALMLMFGVGGLGLFFLKPNREATKEIWNVFLWISLTMGMGILLCLYSIEYYASRNCTKTYDSYLDYLLPYSLDPKCIVWEWKK